MYPQKQVYSWILAFRKRPHPLEPRVASLSGCNFLSCGCYVLLFVLEKAIFSDKNGGGKHCVHKYTTFRGYIIIETLIHEYGLGVDEG